LHPKLYFEVVESINLLSCFCQLS